MGDAFTTALPLSTPWIVTYQASLGLRPALTREAQNFVFGGSLGLRSGHHMDLCLAELLNADMLIIFVQLKLRLLEGPLKIFLVKKLSGAKTLCCSGAEARNMCKNQEGRSGSVVCSWDRQQGCASKGLLHLTCKQHHSRNILCPNEVVVWTVQCLCDEAAVPSARPERFTKGDFTVPKRVQCV